MSEKVKIDSTALEQLLEVRDSGETNMFDFNAVQRIAYEHDFFELVTWMEEHCDEYGRLIMYGAAEEDEEAEETENDNDDEGGNEDEPF